ncbi:MAG: hypothetical protein OEO77_03640 [Acidimicrobiia bacterium]|nr:hypothetical protein [Acidimicrobiia bacterium]
MKKIIHVKGPSSAGPGERQVMMDRAAQVIEQAEAAEVVRVDVPQRGSDMDGDSALRGELEVIVPALQSGSLFGDKQAIEIVDAQWIQKSEAVILAELLPTIDPDAVVVVFVSAGVLPPTLAKVVKAEGETVSVQRFNPRSAREWLSHEVRERKLKVPADAMDALIQRFGTDVASLGQALDQLEMTGEAISRKDVLDRFKNRPDEGMWHYVDELTAGNTGGALRRLEDFLTHGHPLQLVGYLEGDVKKKALAAAAPDLATYAAWVGQSPDDWRVERAWKARTRMSNKQLQQAVAGLSKADRLLKSAPEDTHRLTMERLTIAFTRWYGPRR